MVLISVLQLWMWTVWIQRSAIESDTSLALTIRGFFPFVLVQCGFLHGWWVGFYSCVHWHWHWCVMDRQSRIDRQERKELFSFPTYVPTYLPS